jgi:parallel beta-helix repeat protein
MIDTSIISHYSTHRRDNLMKPIQPLSAKQLLQVSFALFLSTSVSTLYAATIDLMPGDSFEDAVESLQAGDILIVHAGTYADEGRISIAATGTASQPIVIKAADGEARPLITRTASDPAQNTINIEGSSYLTLKGLEITGNGGDGVKFDVDPSDHVILEDLLIHDIDTGINTKNDSNNLTIRNNEIYNTGVNGGTGEGMYIGCHDGSCALSDSIIENNLIHDALPGTSQGDGIEVKFNSQNIVIRDNVIYNMPFPGIFVYGGGEINTIEGNVVSNCLEGISAISDAVVRNNILFNNETGLISFHHEVVPVLENTSFVNNTLFNNDTGAMLRWQDASNMIFANNAVYSPGKAAIDSNTASQIVSSNLIVGSIADSSGDTTDDARFLAGRSAALDFSIAGNQDFWPTAQSPAIGNADDAYTPANDFNDATRQSPSDIGAYQRSNQATNPGWAIGENFKDRSDSVTPPSSSSADIDGNGNTDALTDGLLIIRYLFGSTGDALISGAVADDATRTSAADIEALLLTLKDSNALDIDGNGNADALTDGLLIIRFLFGSTGDALISGAVADDATRTSVADIEASLQALLES